jgi:hypothetical protein
MAVEEKFGTGEGITLRLVKDTKNETKVLLTADGITHEVWISKTDPGAIRSMGHGEGWAHAWKLYSEGRIGHRFYSHLWGHEDYIVPAHLIAEVLA